MGRLGAAVVGMELAALLVAVGAFGWPSLLVGVPLLVGTVVALVVVRVWELVRRRVERRRAARWDQAEAVPGGLMSGFFAVSAVPEQPPLPPVDLPPFLRAARGWAQRTARELTDELTPRLNRPDRDVNRGRRPLSRPDSRRPAPGARPMQRVRALSVRLPRR